ncbi:MAG: transcriptional regulator [Phycisphaerae bacterium]|jgi:predicted transcriptional regulator|nr:MAG: transcriptional regulator [Phycisphaerae bacterium]
MARPKSSTPTPGEIEILQVLWQHGVCTVREVHEQLAKKRPVAHTTVASMMQLMHSKGQLKLVSQTRPFRYEAILGPEGAKDSLLNDILNRLFAGSAKNLVLHLVSGKKASKQQIQQIEKALEGLE